MQSFNQLPFETRLEILKYYPQYRSLSLPYYKEKQLFYKLYCDDPITPKEFLKYIEDYQPDEFTIYGSKDGTYCRIIFYHIFDHYNVGIYDLSVIEYDMYEFSIKIDYNIIKDFNLDDIFTYTDIQYDITTLYNIL